MDRLNGMSLFSGIGGIDIALRDWVRTFIYCELDSYCQGVLLSQMQKGNLDRASIWDDIKTLEGGSLHGDIDIIYGGFPCQDISVAGHGKGLDGERSGLFFEIVRLAKEIKPKYLFLENVAAITSRGGLRVVREITEMGYDCRWCVISAASVGAPHKRERWFLLAHSNSERIGRDSRETSSGKKTPDNIITQSLCPKMANTGFVCERCLQEPGKEEGASFHDPRCGRFWETEPCVGRVVNELPFRMDRIRGLGNAVVPLQAKKAFSILMGLEKE